MRPASPACLALLAAPLAAQGALHTWPPGHGGLVMDVAAAGDVDGDGVDDFAATELTTPGALGWLRVFAGPGGGEILSVQGIACTDLGLQVVALGDVDLDGKADLALGGRDGLRGVSGADGASLWETAVEGDVLGLASIGDVDGDGATELAVGAVSPVPGTAGRAYVVSGRSGVVLRTIPAPAGGSREFGRSVAALGDFDGDGTGDFAVGDHEAQASSGEVRVLSGASGQTLARFNGRAVPFPSYGTGFGWSLASPGDVNGDGVPEVLVGSPFECTNPFGGGVCDGWARLISGADGSILFALSGGYLENNMQFGFTADACGDLNGDGRNDLIIGGSVTTLPANQFEAGSVTFVSSANGETLMHGQHQVGWGLAGVPDVDGDGFDDYLTSSQFFSYSGARLNLSLHRSPSVVGGCAPKLNSEGCYPSISFEGAPSLTLGPDLELRATGVVGGTVGLVVWSPNPGSTPFAGGTLCVAPPIQRSPASSTGGTSSPCSGAFESTLSKGLLASLGYTAPSTIYAQAWYRDPGFAPPDDVGLSSSLVITLWP